MKKEYEKIALYGLLLIVVAILIFSVYSFITPLKSSAVDSVNIPVRTVTFTEFDKKLARDFMDKNQDGKCDVCGMAIEDCIASGMMQCSMDPNAQIGLLNSAHLHADLKVYQKGKPLNLAQESYFVKSKFIHVEPEKNPEATGNIIHIHATGVPLGMFFESIKVNLGTPKLWVNGQPKDFTTYVPKNKDKILVTDGQGNVEEQLASLTDFAETWVK